MQFEMNHKIGTDYSTVSFQDIKINWNVIQSMMILFERLGGKMIDTNLYQFPAFITSEVLQEVIHNTCFVCGGLMKGGQALDNTYVYSDDFGNDAGQYGTTCSKIGQPVMKQVRKCTACGHSHT